MHEVSLRLDSNARFPELPPIPWRADFHEEGVAGRGVRDILGGRFGLEHLFHARCNIASAPGSQGTLFLGPPAFEIQHHRLAAPDAEAAGRTVSAFAHLGNSGTALPPQAPERELQDNEREAQENHGPSCIIAPRISQGAFERIGR